jgi:hypothetical protein
LAVPLAVIPPLFRPAVSESRSDFNHERKQTMSCTTSASTLPNAQRIATARSALSAAMWARGDNPAICDEAVIDLLADLRHFCVARRIDFASCNVIAETHFETEISGGRS